jgi:hypothetical protein
MKAHSVISVDSQCKSISCRHTAVTNADFCQDCINVHSLYSPVFPPNPLPTQAQEIAMPTEYDNPETPTNMGAVLNLLPLWRFTLGRKESLLVMKALGGRLKPGGETDAAKDLGDRLTLQRAHEARTLLEAMQQAEDWVLHPDTASTSNTPKKKIEPSVFK